MSATADPIEDEPAKASKKPLMIAGILAIAGAAGGFFAVNSGLLMPLLGGAASEDVVQAEADSPLAAPSDVGFVPLDTIVVNIQSDQGPALLRFSAQLEVAPAHLDDVAALAPRVLDVLNSYLRAVEVGDLADPASLLRLRSQMLRRVQVVTGPGRVSDLLIVEFVLN